MNTTIFIETLVCLIISSVHMCDSNIDIQEEEKSENFNDLSEYIEKRIIIFTKWLEMEDTKKLIQEYIKNKENKENKEEIIEEIMDIVYTMFPIVNNIYGESFKSIKKHTLTFVEKLDY